MAPTKKVSQASGGVNRNLDSAAPDGKAHQRVGDEVGSEEEAEVVEGR
jgi:hypothetical protein